MVPETSSRHSASRAIMARAESLTALGAMPSAQLIVLSAVAFDDAVRDHFQNAMGHLDEKKARFDLGEARSAGHHAQVPPPHGGGRGRGFPCRTFVEVKPNLARRQPAPAAS